MLFPEYYFIGTCLQVGLTIADLEKLTYVEVMKILLTLTEKKPSKYKKATQSDWDKLAGGM